MSHPAFKISLNIEPDVSEINYAHDNTPVESFLPHSISFRAEDRGAESSTKG